MGEAEKELAAMFLEFSRNQLLNKAWPRLRTCVEGLSEEQVWWRPNEASNSVGNLLLHLQGNVTQWLVASFNRREDKRDRPAEFSARSGRTAAALLEGMSATMEEAARVLQRLSAEDLLAPYEIQGYHVRGLEAVYQVVEHFGQHYGQIAYISKMLSAKDLGFYRELSQTGKVKA